MSKFITRKIKNIDTYIPGEQPKDREYIKLNTNESPFPPSPLAQRLMRQAVGDCALYPDPEYNALLNVAAEVYGVEKGNILFTNGSDEALSFAFSAFCDEFSPAVFADITYGFYRVFADYYGVKSKIVPLREDFSLCADDYADSQGTVFIANPNAPTGILLRIDDIENILTKNPDNVVVIDEAYIDFGGESAVKLIKKYDNLLVVKTFSKSGSMAGARLGVAIGNEEIISDLKKVKYSLNPYNVNRMSAAGGIGVLLDKDYFETNRKKIIETRERLKKELLSIGFSLTDSKANFVFAKHFGCSGEYIYKKLKEKGILVRYFDLPRIKDYVRITVGSDEETDSLILALKQILKEIK